MPVRIRHADGSETVLSGKPSVIAQARRDHLNGCITIEQFEERCDEHFEAAAAELENIAAGYAAGRWQSQTRGGGPYVEVSEQGDCLAACVASILDIPLADVDFPLGEGWWERLHTKLARDGYRIANVRMDAEAPRGFWIATVPSLNLKPKPDDKPIRHCVVARSDSLIHDPSKAERYDAEKWAEVWNAQQIVEGWALAAIDPARLMWR